MVPDTSYLKNDPEWLALITQLRGQKSQLVASFEARFPASDLYNGRVPQAEIDAMADATMEMYAALLSGEELTPSQQRLPALLGRDRARQGVAAHQLLSSVHGNTQVIWNALREIAVNASAALTLMRHTNAVLSLVDWHVREVQSAYLREEEALSRSSAQRRQRSLSRLFRRAELTRDELASIAADLGIAAHDTFDVVVQVGAHLDDCPLCARPDLPTLIHELPEGTCHFSPATGVDLRPHLPGLSAAIATDVEGLELVSQAAAAAQSILQAGPAHPSTPVLVSEAWPRVAWEALIARVPESILPVGLHALNSLKSEERTRLIETLTLYCDTGSIKLTAAGLYCHRNTVVKRITRFEALTGLNISIPRQAALALLALSSEIASE